MEDANNKSFNSLAHTFTKSDARRLTELNKVYKAHRSGLAALRKEVELKQAAISKIKNTSYDIHLEIYGLKQRQFNAQCCKVRFPRIKRPAEVMKDLRKSYRRVKISKQFKEFASYLFRVDGQWVYEVYGIHGYPDKTKQRIKRNGNGRVYYEYPANVDFYLLYREYEDGRCYKSGRVYQSMFCVTFQTGTFTQREADMYGRILVFTKKWTCKYGSQLFVNVDEDPAVPDSLFNYLSRDFDPLEKIRLYKTYRLCRHLFAIKEYNLAFDKRVLRYIKGDKLVKFKNWWKQSESSTYFFWKPKDYSDIKEFILEKNLSQRELYSRSHLFSRGEYNNRLKNYLYRQRCGALWQYEDYIKMLKDAGYPLTYSLIYPKNLKHAHDAMALHKSESELNDIRIERNRTFKNHFEPMTMEDFAMKVIPFNDSADFYNYGRYMNHCYKSVESYYDEVASGSSAMFAICDIVTNEPLSVATYSFENDEVVTNLGMSNAKANEVAVQVANLYVEKAVKLQKVS